MKGEYIFAFIIISATIASLGLLLEGYLLFAICAHFFCALLGIWASVHSAQRGHSIGFDVAMAFFVPITGGLLCALSSQIEAKKRRSGVVSDYMLHIDPEEYRTFFEEERAEFRPEPQKLQPLSDILYSRAPLSEKRLAIEALAQMECPETVKILRDALQMDSVEVRFFSASVLTRLEARLSERMQELEKKSPDDAEGYYELAQAAFEYAFYGMAEGSRKDKYLQTAHDYCLKSLGVEDSAQVYSLLGRIQLLQEDFDAAEQSFAKLLQLHAGDNNALIWQAEAALEKRNFKVVISLCKQAIELGIIPEKMKLAVEYWNVRETK